MKIHENMTHAPTRKEARKVRRRLTKAIKRLKQDPRIHTPHTCTICDYVGPFAPHGTPPRFGEYCPRCGSLSRHRLFALAWNDPVLSVPKGSRILHFAPETSLGTLVREGASAYHTADMFREDTDLKLNIEDLEIADSSYDVVVCNHVLEHVNYEKALAELFRVTAPGGSAFLSVPVMESWKQTYHDPSITEPEQRLLHYGQADHVVYFGADFRSHVTNAGFELHEFASPKNLFVHHGLSPHEIQFVGKKPEPRQA